MFASELSMVFMDRMINARTAERTTTTIRIPQELMERLAAFLVEETGRLRGRNELIIDAIDQWLKQRGY